VLVAVDAAATVNTGIRITKKISPFLHGKGHDVGANDADNDIHCALHGVNSG
jgi:hypothetical protein